MVPFLCVKSLICCHPTLTLILVHSLFIYSFLHNGSQCHYIFDIQK